MKTKNFIQKPEKEKKLFFFIGLIFSLAATLVAFEWRTPYDPEEQLPGTTAMNDLITEEIPVIIIPKNEPAGENRKKRASSKIKIEEPSVVAATVNEAKPECDLPKINVEDLPDETVEDRDIFAAVEQMPAFPGGEIELLRFLKNNIKYPKMSKELGITGIVYVEFIVDTDGTITDVKVVKGVSSDIDREALRVMSAMPKWAPGSQRNKPVQVGMRLPIRFTLK